MKQEVIQEAAMSAIVLLRRVVLHSKDEEFAKRCALVADSLDEAINAPDAINLNDGLNPFETGKAVQAKAADDAAFWLPIITGEDGAIDKEKVPAADACVATSLAKMVTEWVDGGNRLGTDWRPGLADIIKRRLERLSNDYAKTPDLHQITNIERTLGASARVGNQVFCPSVPERVVIAAAKYAYARHQMEHDEAVSWPADSERLRREQWDAANGPLEQTERKPLTDDRLLQLIADTTCFGPVREGRAVMHACAEAWGVKLANGDAEVEEINTKGCEK